jgi:class 3 adenylate cyclase
MSKGGRMEAPETRYVTVGDAQVAYQIVGSGPIDLVYHHGLCHLDLQWDVEPEAAFNRSLASFSRLILFDRRGCGASERMPHGRFPTWEEWNGDLLAVLDAAESQSTAIFAEAEAGPMAMLFAAAHPDRVNALVLGNTAARFAKADDYPIGFEPADVERIADLLESVWGTEGLAVAFPSLAGDHTALGALARLSRAAATPRIAAAQYRYINGRLDARDALSHITTPTLVLQNRRASALDPTTGAPAVALYVAERIAGARFVEVPGEDSLFFAGDHAVVIDEVAEFLTGRRPPVASDRFLTTVLFTDIVASTERAAELGDQRWRDLLDQHDLAVRNQLRRYHGREIKNTGDGFVACFDGPARAIDCAVEIVHDVRTLGLEARAGLHIGECERRGDDIAGLAVHVSARIGALAEPGEVLVSRIVTDLTAGSGITFNDRGEHTLKGIPATWPLFAANPRQ